PPARRAGRPPDGPGARSPGGNQGHGPAAAPRDGSERDACGGICGPLSGGSDVRVRPVSDLHDAHGARGGPPGPRGTPAGGQPRDAPGGPSAHRCPPGSHAGGTAEGTGRAPHHHLTNRGKEVPNVTEVDRAFLRSLVEWRSDGVPVSTLYLDVDGRKYPRRRDFRARGDEL